MASRIEVREENHVDVVRHCHPRHVEVIIVPLANGLTGEVRNNLLHILGRIIAKLRKLQVRHSDVWFGQKC